MFGCFLGVETGITVVLAHFVDHTVFKITETTCLLSLESRIPDMCHHVCLWMLFFK